MPSAARGFAISAGIGVAIGVAFGVASQSVGSSFDGGLPRNFGIQIMTVITIGGIGLLGILLVLPRATRAFGAALLLAAPCAAAGFLVASAIVPENPGQQDLTGTVKVELSLPVSQVLEASAVCTDPGRPDRALEIDAELGRVGIDDLRLFVTVFRGQDSASVRFGVNTMPGYTGTAAVAEMSPDQHTGRATFAGLASSGGWIGGTSANTLSGSFSWECSATGGSPRVSVPPTEHPQYMDGWFTIHGLITVDRNLPSATAPFPGRATGICSSTTRYGVEAMETVVSWPPDGQARLRLVPGETSAGLTIDRGDGSVPQTVAGPAVITERKAGSIVIDRTLRAEFDVREGHLSIEVSWFCPS